MTPWEVPVQVRPPWPGVDPTRAAGTRRSRRSVPGAGPARRGAGLPALLVATRPWFWPVAWLPAWFGAAVATREWLPLAGAWQTGVALLVLGPLVWGSVCLLNDLSDVDTDGHNPRKATSPLVTGALDAGTAWRCALLLAGAAVLLAATVGTAFAVGTAGVLALGWAYSCPPLRLKGRPGWDVAANAVAVGVAGPLAGWSLHAPLTSYPVPLALLGSCLAAALYLPTTALDLATDERAGVTTFAVARGARATYVASVVLWVCATGTWLLCRWLGVLGGGSVSSGSVLAALVPALVHTALAWRPSIPRLATVAVAFTVPAADFVAHLR